MATTTPDSITAAIAPSRQAFFHSVWQDLYSRLNLTSAAKVSASDAELADTLLLWLQASHYDVPHSIVIPAPPSTSQIDPTLPKNANVKVGNGLPADDTITHAFAHIGIYHREAILSVFKSIFYSLIPKGIAVITITKRNPVDSILQSLLSTSSGARRASASSAPATESTSDDDLRELVEQAGFERGKVRIAEKSILVQGDELERLRGEVLGILDAAKGQRGDAQSWERAFDEVWEREVCQNGAGKGLLVECWILVAMKWDLLCA